MNRENYLIEDRILVGFTKILDRKPKTKTLSQLESVQIIILHATILSQRLSSKYSL